MRLYSSHRAPLGSYTLSKWYYWKRASTALSAPVTKSFIVCFRLVHIPLLAWRYSRSTTASAFFLHLNIQRTEFVQLTISFRSHLLSRPQPHILQGNGSYFPFRILNGGKPPSFVWIHSRVLNFFPALRNSRKRKNGVLATGCLCDSSTVL